MKHNLCEIAKTTVEIFLKEGKTPEFKEKRAALEGELRQRRGVFVTLKKRGELRGCIGCMASDMPLYKLVPQMALAAAFDDPRFPAVTEDELPELEYEVSVLSPFRKINSPKEIQLGVHGVQVVAGLNSGLFLPQVAAENDWDLETFLRHLMLKADLEPDYWKNNSADFYVFGAEIIRERRI